ncbi:MAG: caspase family protein [Bacteroidales bacterium]
MKTKLFLLFFLIASISVDAQVMSGKSKRKKVSVTPKKESTEYIRGLPDLIITGERFTDQNGNNFIDAAETCNIMLNVENIGKGTARAVKVQASVKNGRIPGLEYERELSLGDIKPGTSKAVAIPVEGQRDLKNGLVEFQVEVLEERGFDAYPLEMKIESRRFASPKVIVADAAFSMDDGGMVKLNYPIVLEAIVQNIGAGDARDVSVDFILPAPNCFPLSETSSFRFHRLEPGESKKLVFTFTASRRFKGNDIPVKIDLNESFGNYSRDTTLSVRLEQQLTASNEVVISGQETRTPTIAIASLSADVDKNIPFTDKKHKYRYALIIGNEDYSRYQRGLQSESNVDFARTDAKIFKEYAIKTLGTEEGNCFLLTDATAGEMLQKIDLVSKLAAKTPGKSEIIFYYAGHGLPDEASREPYLIPVDVSGSNLNAAVKLNEVYKKFAASEAKRVTVFLDACFSGGGREAGLLAARGVKVKPRQNMIMGNMVVFTASTGEQSALPYKEKEHGMFTYFLLKKIQESKGNMSYGELSEYITQNVSLESLKINQKEQDPRVNISVNVQDEWTKWAFH